MTRKHFLVVLSLVFLLCSSGCSLMPKKTGVDHEKQLAEMTAANTDLRKTLGQTSAALTESEKAAADKQAEITKLQQEKAALAEQLKNLQDQLDKTKPQSGAVKAVGATQPESSGQNGTPAIDAAVVKNLRIKVLAGTTQLAKARVLAMRLRGAGYRIEKLDQSRPFDQSIVYYAAGLDKEAEAIARYLGKNVETKKISWQSIFNIIVAVGKKP